MSTYDYAFPLFLGYLAIAFPIITLNLVWRYMSRAFDGEL